MHRDVAARNCLIADQLVVKLADFAKFMRKYDHCYFQTNPRTRLPIRWMPREALDNIYSSATDVYAFGVTVSRRQNKLGKRFHRLIVKIRERRFLTVCSQFLT